MGTLLIFLAVIAVLVLSHEFGHFIAAKGRGMRVDEFGFGFPPRLFGRRIGETLYSINALPFGGFVKVWGEDEQSSSETPGGGPAKSQSRNFANRGAGDKFLVLVAGVGMNFVLAYLLFTAGHIIGIPSVVEAGGNAEGASVRVVEVVEGSPAASAEIMAGDTLVELRGQEAVVAVEEITDVQEFTAQNAGREITIIVDRFGEMKTLTAALRPDTSAGEGFLGIAMVKIGIVSVPWYRAPWEGLQTTLATTKAVALGLVSFFANIFSADIAGTVTGPIGIAEITGNASALGFIYLLQLVAVLSINLAILNLLPIPALDGGRIFFLGIELLRGRPISAQVSQFAHAAGFAILIFLMLIVTYFDLARIF